MQFAVNYSPQSAALLKEKKIVFDLFKCPDWPDVVDVASQSHPVYVHFPLSTRPHRLETIDWGQIEVFLKQSGTRYINMHLAPHTADFPGMTQDTREPFWREQIMETVLEAVRQVVSRYGADRVIIENVPWDIDPKYRIPRPVIEPEFIGHVLDETGCGLLLDIAHARIAALHLGIEPVAYLKQMPTERLKEIHITGTRYDEDKCCWLDHFPMTDADWLLADDVLKAIHSGLWPKAEIVALEYGGVGPMFDWRSKAEVLLRDVSRLYGLVKCLPVT